MNRHSVFTACRISALLLALVAGATARAVTIDVVRIGNPGNANDPATGNLYGAVNYIYDIGKYEVTIQQYTDFLNAVADTDTYSLYNTSMANGQPTGPQTGTTTENGAYTLSGATSGTAPARNATNPNTGVATTFWIPSENEWYKAAYHDPTLNSGSGGYFTYATRSNSAPGNTIGSGTNQANYYVGDWSVTQSASYSSGQNYLTNVGAFTNSSSYYGTFDQNGNVFEWNDLTGAAGVNRGLIGGSFTNNAAELSSRFARSADSEGSNGNWGFRVAPVSAGSPCAPRRTAWRRMWTRTPVRTQPTASPENR